jgi:hypothetical protein
MAWTVKINGNPTVTCRDEQSGLRSYQQAQGFTHSGHTVELFYSTRRVLPASISHRR